jgi:hypothetical protein
MVHAVLPGARLRSRALLAGALALTCGVLVAGPARAATPAPSAVTCSGHAQRGVEKATPDQIDVLFACSGSIKSYTIISSAPIGFFDVGSTVTKHGTDTIVESDSFFCEGLIPGDGYNCTGQALVGGDVHGDFETNDPVCSTTVLTPPLKLQVVVADVNGATAGPFRLRGPAACPKPKPAKKHKKHVKHVKHAAR